MPIGPGEVLKDTYVLGEPMGQGAMGTVYRAEHRTLGNEVAVKVLRSEGDRVPRRARFEREARGVALLDSPHIVRVFDYGVTGDGEPFLVMELLRGRDLGAWLDDDGSLFPEDCVRVIRHLCVGLSCAHERGVIHRDIKPANVFVQDVAGEPFIKVLDFGVAKLAHTEMSMTASGTVLGTPYYMSPEQFIGPRDIDPRADLWSVAVVAYECLTGDVPFVADTIGGMSLAVHRGEFLPPSALLDHLPPAVDEWFERALAPEPDARFRTALELAGSFGQVLRGVPPAGSARPHVQLRQDNSAGDAATVATGSVHDDRITGDAHTLGAGASEAPLESGPVVVRTTDPPSRDESTLGASASPTSGSSSRPLGTLTGAGSPSVTTPPPTSRSATPMLVGGALALFGLGAFTISFMQASTPSPQASAEPTTAPASPSDTTAAAEPSTASSAPAPPASATASTTASPSSAPPYKRVTAAPKTPLPAAPRVTAPSPPPVVYTIMDMCWNQPSNWGERRNTERVSVSLTFSKTGTRNGIGVNGGGATFSRCVRRRLGNTPIRDSSLWGHTVTAAKTMPGCVWNQAARQPNCSGR